MLIARLLIALPLASLLGFLLPGYLLARLLQSREKVCTGFVLSILLLYNGGLLLRFTNLPVRFETMLGYLLLATALLGVMTYRKPLATAPAREMASELAAWPRMNVVLPCVVVMAAIMALRCTVQPLAGYDAPIRWDLLAAQMLEHERFDFYPPLIASDFHYYGMPDAIAPVVSICYWWIYAAAGAHVPAATAFFVLAQWVSILVLAYRMARAAAGTSAGSIAICILVATPHMFRSVAMGQETGLTALSVLAMFYALTGPAAAAGPRQAILAGLLAAPCALAREYGWVVLPCGLIAIVLLQRGRRAFLTFLLVAGGVAAPWYLENWLRMGNPIYPTRIGDLFPVNPVYSGIIDTYRVRGSIGANGPALWYPLFTYLLRQAPIQLLLGPIAFVLAWRRHAHLAFAALAFCGLWLWSIGYTLGGAHYAARMLTPSVAAVSIMMAFLTARTLDRGAARKLAGSAYVVCLGWALLNALTYPLEPRASAPAGWAHTAFRPLEFGYREPRLREMLKEHLPAGSRVLTDSSYAHAALIGSEIEAVIVWSPEVSFLFESGTDAATAHRKLKEARIVAVYYANAGASSRYLSRFQFFERLPAEPTASVHRTQFGTLYVLPDY